MDLMEERQESRKPSCGLCNKRFTSTRILQNHMKITHFSSASSDAGESSNQRDFSRRYSLRKNPKKTRKSPESNSPEKSLLDHAGVKKNLIRCKECGKGFRYEKCLSKHHIGLHLGNQRASEESRTCSSSFSLVRKKRSRIVRYKKARISSFSTLPGFFPFSETELEVAESLILLSRSSGNCLDGLELVDELLDSNLDHDAHSSLGCLSTKKMRNAGEFDQGFLGDERKQLGEDISVDETLKDLFGYSGYKNSSEGGELDRRLVHDHEQKKLGSGDYAGEAELKRTNWLDESRHMLYDTEMEIEIDPKKNPWGNESGSAVIGSVSSKPGCNDAGYEVSGSRIMDSNPIEFSGYNVNEAKPASTIDSVTEELSESERSSEHRCRTCDKVFLSYQALGGHQTLHRMRIKSACRPKAEKGQETVELECVNDQLKHKCIVCSRVFRSVHALGGHKKSHGGKRSAKARDEQIVMRDEELGMLDEIDLNVPAIGGIEF